MEQNLQDTVSVLARTPGVLAALLRDLPDAWTLPNEGGNTWSPFEIVAHLLYSEHTDWIPRAKIILEFGERRTFEPLDRAELRASSYSGRTWSGVEDILRLAP